MGHDRHIGKGDKILTLRVECRVGNMTLHQFRIFKSLKLDESINKGKNILFNCTQRETFFDLARTLGLNKKQKY